MRCLKPRRVGFQSDGKTIAWSQKKYDRQYATFALPCGKCIECRLEYARQWAVRCVHEAKMHPENSFITLTYDDAHLESSKLIYKHFQDFAKRLRHTSLNTISYFVTGEYGDKKKRPHWHAIIFNWRPKDLKEKYKTERGDLVYDSESLTRLWGRGFAECGSVTFESAGYCARYAAKKLVHGNDGDHDYLPISRKSSKRAIGRSWLERYYKDAFSYGEIVLDGGEKCGIPRYYEKWLKQYRYEEWLCYIGGAKAAKTQSMDAKTEKERNEYAEEVDRVLSQGLPYPIDKQTVKKIIIEDKFKRLQEYLKGDI